jgi:hypothetical protein
MLFGNPERINRRCSGHNAIPPPAIYKACVQSATISGSSSTRRMVFS